MSDDLVELLLTAGADAIEHCIEQHDAVRTALQDALDDGHRPYLDRMVRLPASEALIRIIIVGSGDR